MTKPRNLLITEAQSREFWCLYIQVGSPINVDKNHNHFRQQVRSQIIAEPDQWIALSIG